MNQHYLSALRKYEAVKDEYDALRKRYDDLISSHSSAVNKVCCVDFRIIETWMRFDDKQ